MTDDLKQELLSPSEVAELWGVNVQSIIRYAENGYLRGFIMNSGSPKPRWRIYADSVRERMGLTKNIDQATPSTEDARPSTV